MYPRIPKSMFEQRPEHLTKRQWRTLLRSLMTKLTKEQCDIRDDTGTHEVGKVPEMMAHT